MPTLVKASDPVAQHRRVYFDLRAASDGLTPGNAEGGGQPQVSTNGGAFTAVGIGTLTLIGRGRYYADLTVAAVATAGDHVETAYVSAAVVDSPGDSVQVVGFDPTSDLAAVKAKTDTLGSGVVVASAPVAASGDATVLKGDDYYLADGRSLQWSSSSWPDLTAATGVTFSLRGAYAGSFSAACVVLTAGPGITQAVYLQLSAAQTTAFVATAYDFEVVATLSDSHKATLVRAKFYVNGE